MIRKQKEYKIGTLLKRNRRVLDYDAWLNKKADGWEHGIIHGIHKAISQNGIRYEIKWYSGENQLISAKVLKGVLKSGAFKILWEG